MNYILLTHTHTHILNVRLIDLILALQIFTDLRSIVYWREILCHQMFGYYILHYFNTLFMSLL